MHGRLRSAERRLLRRSRFRGLHTFPGEYQVAPELGRGGLPRLAYFNEADRGGHFAAWEEPELFSEEVRAAFRSLR